MNLRSSTVMSIAIVPILHSKVGIFISHEDDRLFSRYKGIHAGFSYLDPTLIWCTQNLCRVNFTWGWMDGVTTQRLFNININNIVVSRRLHERSMESRYTVKIKHKYCVFIVQYFHCIHQQSQFWSSLLTVFVCF